MNPQITIKPNRTSVTVEPRETTIAPIERQQTVIEEHQETTTIVRVGIQGSAGRNGGSGASYEQSFTQADLTIANRLPITHGLNSYPSGVTVWNGSGEAIGPDRVEVLSVDIISLELSSFAPLQGTFTVSVTT